MNLSDFEFLILICAFIGIFEYEVNGKYSTVHGVMFSTSDNTSTNLWKCEHEIS